MSEKFGTARKIILFVGLTWLVLLTPKLFRTPPQNSVTPAAGVGSGDSARNIAAGAGAPVTTQTQPAPLPSAAQPPADTTTAVQPTETVSVQTPLSNFQFSNKGATITGVQLNSYRVLAPSGGNIDLLRTGEPMLKYSLLMGGELIPLQNTIFQSRVDSGPNGPQAVEYVAGVPGKDARISIRYAVVPDSYVVRVSGRIEGAAAPAVLLTQLPTGLRSGEADTVEDRRHYAVAFKPVGDNAEGINFAKMKPQSPRRIEETPLSWVAVKSKYFIVGLLKPAGADAFERLEVAPDSLAARAGTHLSAFVVDDVSSGSFAFDVYAGPQEWRRLTALGRDFQNSNPYGGFLQPVVQPFATLVMKALLWLKSTTNLNYGWVLVVFGVLIRLLLWPLNQKAMRTSLKMQRLQPELQEVQKKYKNNPQKQQEELMRVYRDHGMTPFSPLAGCLPMLIPMPVLFALFFVFQNTIEFRGVPFLWLPDISLKDPLYIVPIFMGASMFLMSWLGARGAPQNPQTKMMMYILPGMMTLLFLNFASGLNLYYAVQNIAALPQQWLIAREKKKEGQPAGQTASRPPSKSRAEQRSKGAT